MTLVAFRADASMEIGTGHVMRCLTLATALSATGAECFFLCRPHVGSLIALVERHGFNVLILPELSANLPIYQLADYPSHYAWLGTSWQQDAQDSRDALEKHLNGRLIDWLILDHYGLDKRWEQFLRPFAVRLMVIDDLADRRHDCDILLDQNLGRGTKDYESLLPKSVQTLLGPQYALLRPEFAQARAASLARRKEPKLRHLLIAMGGVDKDNVTEKILRIINECDLQPGLTITVVLGPRAPWIENVRAQAATMKRKTDVKLGVENMAQLMTESDFAIGAGGTTTWERCCLGVPSLIMVLAQNQLASARAVYSKGASMVLESEAGIEHAIQAFVCKMNNSTARVEMSDAAAQIVDGLGAQRVVQKLMQSYG